ncbi:MULTISPECIES: alginate lyase family protein [Sphingobacterium]|uniref:alginate lyase family protein n=1 Tax=Sphingobacterium TaxID=28453 RepID=UPI00095CBC1E|nr:MULTISPECIES: alginate lyase family protein [Sphingobacterium]OJZ07621.1 MAG: alginate lyase [Sphingobacterium sp. 40-24]
MKFTSIVRVMGCLLGIAIFPLFLRAKMKEGVFEQEIIQTLRPVILKQSKWAMKQKPVTVTAYKAVRSAGGIHDFYSEGDYWWPDPKDPAAPYIQRDGMTSPANFVEHRKAMIRFSRIVGALASAYRLNPDKKYVQQALRHLKAWFVDAETMMNPNLLYAQAIQGRFTGRGIGIIDTIHLMEVAQGVKIFENDPNFPQAAKDAIHRWFATYLRWLTTHQYGIDEMNAANNHGTCWVMQVAAFSSLVQDTVLLNRCADRYAHVLLPNQMESNGSFPRELQRTKPYGYALFNLDAMTMICQILSKTNTSLWQYTLSDGRTIKTGVDFMVPYIADKEKWPYPKDVMYWDQWPIAHPALVFSAEAYQNKDYLQLWKKLDHAPEQEEVVRNLPIRNPIIWL